MATTKKQKTPTPPKRPLLYGFYLIVILVLAIAYFFLKGSAGPKETTWQTFKSNMLLQHDVERIEVINKERVEVYIKPDSIFKGQYSELAIDTGRALLGLSPHYYFSIGELETFERHLDEAQANFAEGEKVPVKYVTEHSIWPNLLTWLIPLGFLLFFGYFMMRRTSILNRGNDAAINFGKSKAEEYGEAKVSPFTFKDVAGYEEAKAEVVEIVEFLKHPDHFTKLGAKIPKGVLLIGPPGTGKTLMAKAVAGEAAVPFFSLSGSEFIELFVGIGASRVRDLFDRAKAKAPSIIFIDEIDTIGRIRGRAVSLQVNDERESTLNQLLAEMDGFDPNTGVIVMAATNRADILDPALLRPGRFDRHVYLELPNKQERDAIFKVHLKPLSLAKGVDSGLLAAQTPGFSGADIANVCNEAALIAARKSKKVVEPQDFSDAIDRIIAGIEKKTMTITGPEKKIIAYHEAGHTIVGWMLPHIDPLVKVSIIPRGESLGGAWYLPEERHIITKSQFLDQLCASLGGRAAEEIVFGEASSGALEDIEQVTKLAYTMVMKLGLSEKLGNISFHDSTGSYDEFLQKPYSEATAQLIDQEVLKLVEEEHKRAKAILLEHREKLDELADLLQEKEVLQREDVEKVLGARKLVEVA